MGGENPVVMQVEAVAERGYHASTIVAMPRPDEIAYPLPKDEFDTLCDNDSNDTRAGRDLCMGCLVGSLVGLIGVLATTDWDNFWKPEHHRGGFFFFSALLLIIAAASATGALIYHQQSKKVKNNSPFSRLQKRIETWFAANPNQ